MAQQGLELAEGFVNGASTIEEIKAERVKLWEDLGDESLEFESKKNNGYRAVFCALYERDPEDSIYADYDVVTGVIHCCNTVRKTLEQTHYELMRSIFGLAPAQD